MPTFEITGTRTLNCGADLMTSAICNRLRQYHAGCKITVPNYFGSSAERADRGLFCTMDHPGKRASAATFSLRFAPAWVRESIGICTPSEIDVVLDANGFAFSDQWGPGAAEQLYKTMSARSRRKQVLILMPQAMGPFTNTKVSLAVRRLFDRASLICARDTTSYDFCRELGNYENLLQFPDFSVSATAAPPPSEISDKKHVFVIPNARMLDKSSSSNKYFGFLRYVATLLWRRRLSPAFLIHGGKEDRSIVDDLALEFDMPVIESPNPQVLKGIIGSARFVIGSRFHALVSALSQGVPCIGAGWSHKYEELFGEYDSQEFLLNDLADLNRCAKSIESLADTASHDQVVSRLSVCAATHRKRVDAMWEVINRVIASQRNVNA